jgi:hypothetical protein
MRLWKLIWVTAGAGALIVGRHAAAGEISWGRCWWEPVLTWYAPNSPWPPYFIPPYPHTSYLPSFYPLPPPLTALAVKNQLVHMGAYPVPLPKETLPPPNKETLPPPTPEGKKPEQAPPPKPEEKKKEAPQMK